MKVPLTFVAAIAFGSAHGAVADEQADNLAKAFLGSCVNVLPRLDKIEAMANSLKWRPLVGDELKAIEPQNKSSITKGWLADISGTPPFYLATAKATENGYDILTCSAANPEAPAQDVTDSLTKFLKLGQPQFEGAQGGIRMRVWFTDIGGNHLWLSVSDSSPTNDPGVTLAAMLKQ